MAKVRTSPLDGARWVSGPAYDYGADDAGYYDDHRNHIVHGSLQLDAVPCEVWLTVAVLGYARVLVNGEPASDEVLVGDWTNYAKLVTCRSWNVVHLLHVGGNTIDIELGNGFYNPAPLTLFGKYNLRERLAEVGTPCVMASLATDEGEVLLKTDESWTYTQGQLLFNNPYLGERRDLRLGATTPRPVVARENTHHLEPAQVEPIRCCSTVEGSDVHEVSLGGRRALVIDLHEMVTGFADFTVRAHEGQVVRVSYAEHLDAKGNLAFDSNLAGMVGDVIPHAAPDGSDLVVPGGAGAPKRALEQDVLICTEGENHFENAFATHSFRYALVEGVVPGDLVSFRAHYVHTDLVSVGSLSTGNAWYDELLTAAQRTKLNNVHGVWEDCAREHLGYGGDMVALAESNLSLFDCEGLIRKTVRDFRNDQTAVGGVPETAPYMGIQSMGTGPGEGPLLWQLAYPHLILEAYRWYGARDLVEEEWPYVRKQADYLLSRDPGELAQHCLGDHGSIETRTVKEGDWKGGTPDRDFTSWCAILWLCRMAEEFCEILGEDELRTRYLAKDEALVEQIRARFAHDGGFGDLTQTSYTFAGGLGLMDEQAAGDVLARLIAEEGDVLSAGIFGASFAWRILHRTGHDDVVEAWLNREGKPSYHHMLATGNGALTEQFDPGQDSYNHAMFSSYAQWLFQALAGIELVDVRAMGDGSYTAQVRVAPYYSPRTNHVRASLETRAGRVCVEWTRDAHGYVSLSIDAPASIAIE